MGPRDPSGSFKRKCRSVLGLSKKGNVKKKLEKEKDIAEIKQEGKRPGNKDGFRNRANG